MTDIATAGLYQAVPLDVLKSPTKLEYIVDRLVEHEHEWSDFQKGRRDIAIHWLGENYTNPSVRILEVWRMDGTAELCGLIGFSHILPEVSAQFHPVFFDGKLRNVFGKLELGLRALDWAFRHFGLHRIGMEVPETAPALIDFARRKLGFRFEAEKRTIAEHRRIKFGHVWKTHWPQIAPSDREASYGSRRYQALKKNGQWLDVILLSVTVDEFQAFVRESHPTWASSTDPPHSKPSPVISEDSAAVSSDS